MSVDIPGNSQYLIQPPSGIGFVPGDIREQSRVEKNLSGKDYAVATLSPERVAELQAKGYTVRFNQPMSVPDPVGKVTQVNLSQVAPMVTVGVAAHGADKLHDQGIKGAGVTVCVIDTGLEPHNAIAPRIKKFYDVFDKAEEAPNDGHGHGTHCGGIAGAAGNIIGMAPQCDFIGIKVLSDSGGGSWASVMSGIDQAMTYFKAGHDPMVVSMSLGGSAGPVANDPVVAKVREAMDLGISFVIAAGNSGSAANTIGSPGTTPEAVTVAAGDTKDTVSQDDDTIAYFSSRGGDNAANGQVGKPDITADGYKVLSLGKNNTFVRMSGTSMATPYVAGAVAQLMGMAKAAGAEGNLAVDAKQIDYAALLYETANDRPQFDGATEGAGNMRVDLAAKLLRQRFFLAPVEGQAPKSGLDRQRAYRFEAGENEWVVDRTESIRANQLHRDQMAERAGTLDRLAAARDKTIGRRMVAFLHDIAEAPALAVGVAKDQVDIWLYRARGAGKPE